MTATKPKRDWDSPQRPHYNDPWIQIPTPERALLARCTRCGATLAKHELPVVPDADVIMDAIDDWLDTHHGCTEPAK